MCVGERRRTGNAPVARVVKKESVMRQRFKERVCNATKEERRAAQRSRERGMNMCQANGFCSREICDGLPEEAGCVVEAEGGIGCLVVPVGVTWAR